MGSGNSGNYPGPVKPVDEQTVRMMLPVYFVDGKVATSELELAKSSWERITSSSGSHYLMLKGSEISPLRYETAVEWFHTTFYERLFDVHPLSRAMFRDLKTQGHFLVALFSFIFQILEDEIAFHKKLLQLAESHCKKGVKAIEYGIIGEVMFWTLRACLNEQYTAATHKAWVKIFSNMLAVIVPIAVAHELASSVAQEERLQGEKKTSNYTYTRSDGSNPFLSQLAEAEPDGVPPVGESTGEAVGWELGSLKLSGKAAGTDTASAQSDSSAV